MPDAQSPLPIPLRAKRPRWRDYAKATAIVALTTLVTGLGHWWSFREANVVMIYLAGVAFTAARYGHGPALASVALSALSFDFFFVPPVFAFALVEVQYGITLVVMIAVGWLISEIMKRLKAQLAASQLQERRTAQLYRMTRRLGHVAGVDAIVSTAGGVIEGAFDAEAAIYLRSDQGEMEPRFGETSTLALDPSSLSTAERAATQLTTTRAEGATADQGPALFVPMSGLRAVIGVVAARPRQADRFLDPGELRMLETCANLLALSLEREQTMAQATRSQTEVETEKLRNTLLTSISHDLRTPLATIAVTTSSLLEGSDDDPLLAKRDVVEAIVEETRQLGRQVDNILDLGRLASEDRPLAVEWHVLDELVEMAFARMEHELSRHDVHVEIPEDFPMIRVADDLMIQVIINLLANAARYTPPGSRIEVRASRVGDRAEIRVADNGPGIPAKLEEAIFDKFVRGASTIADGRRGLGLGLAICRSIVRAHDGEITARNLPAGGAELLISLPSPRESPQVTLDEAPQTLGG